MRMAENIDSYIGFLKLKAGNTTFLFGTLRVTVCFLISRVNIWLGGIVFAYSYFKHTWIDKEAVLLMYLSYYSNIILSEMMMSKDFEMFDEAERLID